MEKLSPSFVIAICAIGSMVNSSWDKQAVRRLCSGCMKSAWCHHLVPIYIDVYKYVDYQYSGGWWVDGEQRRKAITRWINNRIELFHLFCPFTLFSSPFSSFLPFFSPLSFFFPPSKRRKAPAGKMPVTATSLCWICSFTSLQILFHVFAETLNVFSNLYCHA